MADLAYNPDGGPRPEVLITGEGSYSDLVFAILTLLGFDYRPVLADLPDAKLWRIDRGADYGKLDRTARGSRGAPTSSPPRPIGPATVCRRGRC